MRRLSPCGAGAFSFGERCARQCRGRAGGDESRTDGRQQRPHDDRSAAEEPATRKRDFWPKLIAANRAGERRGIPSWCTAHPQTLSAVLAAHRDGDEPILIEATCNQVNHEGGYTGMTRRPSDASSKVSRAAPASIPPLILGGDHLGPNPWKRLPAKEAMARACDMVKAYVEAGFAEIHLDASMACSDETSVSEETIAERGAELCAAAEAAGPGGDRVYVIGTEVPIPGGELNELDALAVTKPAAAHRTFELIAAPSQRAASRRLWTGRCAGGATGRRHGQRAGVRL